MFRGIAAVTHIRNERLFENMCSRPDRILAAYGLGAHGWDAATGGVALSVNRLTPYILHFIFIFCSAVQLLCVFGKCICTFI